MSSYILVMRQSGGCDYTISCGTKVVILDAKTPEEAVLVAEDEMNYHGDRVDKATIYKVEGTVPFDVKAIRAQRKAYIDAIRIQRKEAAEKAELARLKAKYGT